MERYLQPLVVTTQHRGVFFGMGTPSDAPTIRLEQCQMCVYWDKGGVMSLASEGPGEGCRITGAVPAMTLREVTGVMEATAQAKKRWEAAPWSR